MSFTAYALAEGVIPVVDMKNYPSQYHETDKLKKENAWEYYFEQPCGLGLEDIQNSKFKKSPSDIRFHGIYYGNFDNPAAVKFWRSIYREFFRLNAKTKEHVNEEYNKLIKPGTRVLGVLCRGTDYISHVGLPVQPKVENIIKKCVGCLDDWNCDALYLATEDVEILNEFKETFGDKLLAVSQMRYTPEASKDKFLAEIKFERENDAYLRGLEYLTVITILSRCNCLIAGRTSGSSAAAYINDGRYEHQCMFELDWVEYPQF